MCHLFKTTVMLNMSFIAHSLESFCTVTDVCCKVLVYLFLKKTFYLIVLQSQDTIHYSNIIYDHISTYVTMLICVQQLNKEFIFILIFYGRPCGL